MFLIIWLMMAVLCAGIANSKGRSGIGWLGAGVLFGVFAFVILLCLPKLEK